MIKKTYLGFREEQQKSPKGRKSDREINRSVTVAQEMAISKEWE